MPRTCLRGARCNCVVLSIRRHGQYLLTRAKYRSAPSMNTVARMGAAVALMWGVGCASPDWIERTLVTVDVTGTWEGSAARSNSGTFQLSLEQQGSQVK